MKTKVREWMLNTSQIDILSKINSKMLSGCTCVGEVFGKAKGGHCADKGCYQCLCDILKGDSDYVEKS